MVIHGRYPMVSYDDAPKEVGGGGGGGHMAKAGSSPGHRLRAPAGNAVIQRNTSTWPFFPRCLTRINSLVGLTKWPD